MENICDARGKKPRALRQVLSGVSRTRFRLALRENSITLKEVSYKGDMVSLHA